MTDREILEAAAEAGGHIPLQWDESRRALLCETMDGTPRYYWTALDDDGDALRLAVKRRMSVFHSAKHAHATDAEGYIEEKVRHDVDPCAATRRAITRCAALSILQNQ